MNKVTHFEFPWDDKERAKSFYQNVFDWKPFEWEQFGYTSWQTGAVDEKMQPIEPGFINGGSSKRDPDMPYPMFYVDVPDIDLALSKVVENGGAVVRFTRASEGAASWPFKRYRGNERLGESRWQVPIRTRSL